MTARFAIGQRVRIADRDPVVHNRTPAYARGKVGVVCRVCRAFGQPELLAYGGSGEPAQTLYRVHVAQRELWPERAESSDTLEIEIFEHWLEPEEEA